MVYDTEDPTRIAQMNDEMRAIESMVIVGVLKYTAAGKEHGNWRDSAAGFGVTLRCHSARNHGACAKKAAGPVRLNSTTRTTLLDCLIELRRKLQEEHGSCISAVNEHAELNFARSSGYLSMLTSKSTKSLSCTSMSIKLSGLLRLLMCLL